MAGRQFEQYDNPSYEVAPFTDNNIAFADNNATLVDENASDTSSLLVQSLFDFLVPAFSFFVLHY